MARGCAATRWHSRWRGCHHHGVDNVIQIVRRCWCAGSCVAVVVFRIDTVGVVVAAQAGEECHVLARSLLFEGNDDARRRLKWRGRFGCSARAPATRMSATKATPEKWKKCSPFWRWDLGKIHSRHESHTCGWEYVPYYPHCSSTYYCCSLRTQYCKVSGTVLYVESCTVDYAEVHIK